MNRPARRLRLVTSNPAPSWARQLVDARGLVPVYTVGMRCPGCGRRAWIIGRTLAECGNCGTAVGLEGVCR